MKLSKVRPDVQAPSSAGSSSDRLTQALIWVVFLLVAAVAAIGADLLQTPPASGAVAQAAGATKAVPTQTPSPAPTLLPDVTDTLSPTQPITATVTPPPCVPPNDWGIHIVQDGNTLYSIAQRYGTDVDTLMYVNCLNTYTIFIDQRLYVPGGSAIPVVPTPAPTLTPPAAASTPEPESTSAPELTPAPGASPTPLPQSAMRLNIPNRYLNIVLLGSDKRPTSGTWRTDSMIIVSIDTESDMVRLLSLPRDLWVLIPGHGYNRINTADLWGELAKKGSGPDRVKQTIYYNLGIPIHYYVRVDFQGFIKIIDVVGGIDVDVECPLPDISLSAGIHHMDGKQALRYARSRKSTNDFDRGRRQRKVLMALWQQGLTMDLVPKLPSLWRTMADSFQTDLPLSQVINLAYMGTQLKPQHLLSRAIGPSLVEGWMTPEGAAVLLPRQDRIRAYLEGFYAPKDASGLATTGKVRLRILNGSTRREAELLASSALRWEGFQIVGTGAADRQNYAQSQIWVFNGDLTTGARLADQLGVPATAVVDKTGAAQPDPSSPVEIQVILGLDYDPCPR